MSAVWVTVPSKRPAEHVKRWAEAWRDMGYKVAVWRDGAASFTEWGEHGFDVYRQARNYPGYAQATNTLIAHIAEQRSDARWFVIGGDDVFPDPTKRADEIAVECEAHFYSNRPSTRDERLRTQTFGVMQPTGDRYGDDEPHEGKLGSAYIDRTAGSAWIGREFALRVNGGAGPLWPEYFHMGCDEELRAVAVKLGVYWERPELTHRHDHWARARRRAEDRPAFLDRANSGEEWAKYKRDFARRKREGFPGHEVKA